MAKKICARCNHEDRDHHHKIGLCKRKDCPCCAYKKPLDKKPE